MRLFPARLPWCGAQLPGSGHPPWWDLSPELGGLQLPDHPGSPGCALRPGDSSVMPPRRREGRPEDPAPPEPSWPHPSLFIISCSAQLRLHIWRRSFSAFGPRRVFVRVLTGRKGSRRQKTPVSTVLFRLLTFCLLVSWRVFRPSPQGLSLLAGVFPDRQAFPAGVKRRGRPSHPDRGF